MKPLTVLALFLVLLAACAPSATPIPVPPTPDAPATETQIALKIFATLTASAPTATSTATATAMPSATAVPSATPTPLPTRPPTETPRPTPTLNPADDKKTFQFIDVREFAKATDRYKGQKLGAVGKVFNIKEDASGTRMQIWTDSAGLGKFREVAVYVTYPGSLPNLYEDDAVVVYGIGSGTMSGTNSLGGSVTQPALTAVYIEYDKAAPMPPVKQGMSALYKGRWEIAVAGLYRDKTRSIGLSDKPAAGIYATVELRVRNRSRTAWSLDEDLDPVALTEDGKYFKPVQDYELMKALGAGDEAVLSVVFDVPETTGAFVIVPRDLWADRLLSGPRFMVEGLKTAPSYTAKPVSK